MKAIKNFFISIGTFFKSLFVSVDGKEPKLKTLYKNDGFKSVLASIMCVIIGIILGLVVMMLVSFTTDKIYFSDSFLGLKKLITGPVSTNSFGEVNVYYSSSNFSNMLFYVGPLILTGLSVAIAFKTGLFNIGAPGQYLMGTMGSLLVALKLHTSGRAGGVFVWILAVLVGVMLGALWGCIPGIFKAIFDINEVIVCIMTNWIAANIVSWVFQGQRALQNVPEGKTGYLIKTSTTFNFTPKFDLTNWASKLNENGNTKMYDFIRGINNSYLDIGIIIAIVVAIMIFIIMNKTTFGYELKSCGSNKHASKYAGMNEKRNIILSMAIAGALAGLGACLYYLNPGIEFKWNSAYSNLPAEGFNGIPAALLASSNPIGVIFSSLLIKYLAQGGSQLSSAGYNKYFADIVVAVIIYFAGFTKFFKEILSKNKKNSHVLINENTNTGRNKESKEPLIENNVGGASND